jgi:hypothetical protein
MGTRKGILLWGLVLTLGWSAHLAALNQYFLIFEARTLPYGSRLIAHSEAPPRSTVPRVVFIGNSVLQYTPLIDQLRMLRNEHPNKMFDVLNFGAVGASIADMLFVQRWVQQFKPDLVVFHFNAHAFFSGEPLLRTDLKKMIFREPFRDLRGIPAVRGAYARDEWVEALVFSYFAPYRWIPVIQNELKEGIRLSGLNVMDFFPWRLNQAEEWREAQSPTKMAEMYSKNSEYEQSSILMDELLNSIKNSGVRALIVLQERKTPLYPTEMRIKTNVPPGATVLDLSSNFLPEHFRDGVHFNLEGARVSATKILPSIHEILFSEPHR